MIFVTVGTHEQQFNRLIQEIDRLKKDDMIKDDVLIQTGYSTYEPKYCRWVNFVEFSEMSKYLDESDIVITHGGPASFIDVLQRNKIPIVVPRKVSLNEHVNDHQLHFAKKLLADDYPIIVIDDISELKGNILNYKNQNSYFDSHNKQFINEFIKIIKNTQLKR